MKTYNLNFILSLFTINYNNGTLIKQLWNLAVDPPVAEANIATNGKVRHIEVYNEHVFWSVEEPVFPDQLDITAGTVHLLANPQTFQTIPVRVSH